MGVRAVAVGKEHCRPTVALCGNLGGEASAGANVGGGAVPHPGAASVILNLYPIMLTSACRHVHSDGENTLILSKGNGRSQTLSEMTFFPDVHRGS